jgi:hypothetical protein
VHDTRGFRRASTTLATSTLAASPAVLPFAHLRNHAGIAVDVKGNVRVAGGGSNRVSKLAAGAVAATVLPFAGLNSPSDVAFAVAGNVYLRDRLNFRMSALTPTSRDVALSGQVDDKKLTFYEIDSARQNGPAPCPPLLGADWENECEHQSIRRRRW